MARNKKRQKIKFYFPTKIQWNPFSWLDRKSRGVPKRITFASFFFLVSSFLLINKNIEKKQQVLGEQAKIKEKQEIVYQWEEIVEKYPDYRDGWMQLAYNYLKNNEIEKAKESLMQAKSLDPNDKTIKELEKILLRE